MKKVREKYELSIETDNDINKIFKYTYKEFGLKQAIKYTTEFHEIYNHLLENPTIGRYRLDIKKGLYSLAKGKHVIFYRILSNRIRIVRVLHGSKDLPRHF